VLDYEEAWRFVKENMAGIATKAGFDNAWEMMDKDMSGGVTQ
jgi:hypothetical protein